MGEREAEAVAIDHTRLAELAKIYARAGEPETAVQLLEDGLRQALYSGQAAPANRIALNLTFTLCEAGRIGEARTILEQAPALDDIHAHARRQWAEARLLSYEGDLTAASHELAAATAILEATEDTISTGRVRRLLAEFLNVLERHEEAAEQARVACGLLVGHPEIVNADAEYACAIARKNPSLASEIARRCVEQLVDAEPWESHRAYWALGDAALAEGDAPRAVLHFLAAVELMRPDTRYAPALLERLAAAARAVSHSPAPPATIERDLNNLDAALSSIDDELEQIRQHLSGDAPPHLSTPASVPDAPPRLALVPTRRGLAPKPRY